MNDTNTSPTANDGNNDLTALTAQIVSAFVGNSSNTLGSDDIGKLIPMVHSSLLGLSGEAPAAEERPEPAVSIRASIKPDYLVCLENGQKLKMLKRYLRTNFNMTPDEYRARWGLPADYPMVAPNYAETRRELAKKIGLGRKPGQKPAAKKAAPKKKAA